MERSIVNNESGEVITSLNEGDRIVRRESIESYKRKSKDSRSFVKIDTTEVNLILKDLNQGEMALLFALQAYVSYQSCIIKYANGRDISFDNVVEISGLSRNTVNNAINSLIKKNILYKGKNGRNIQYFMNPWIASKGPEINPTLKEMFKNYKIRSLGNKTWGELSREN